MTTEKSSTKTAKAPAKKAAPAKSAEPKAPKAPKVVVPPFEAKTTGERAWIAWSNGKASDEPYYRELDRKVELVKAHAYENFETLPWDLIETLDDDQIRDIVWRARTDAGAIEKLRVHLQPIADARGEVEQA